MARRDFPLFRQGLVRYRQAAGLSQEQLARQLGITVSALQKWEGGVNLPTFKLMGRLLSGFGRQGWSLLASMGMHEDDIRVLAEGFLNRGSASSPERTEARRQALRQKLMARLGEPGTPVSARECALIRRLAELGEPQAEIARRRGVSRQRIGQIVSLSRNTGRQDKGAPSDTV